MAFLKKGHRFFISRFQPNSDSVSNKHRIASSQKAFNIIKKMSSIRTPDYSSPTAFGYGSFIFTC